jgi:hypothetical protein
MGRPKVGYRDHYHPRHNNPARCLHGWVERTLCGVQNRNGIGCILICCFPVLVQRPGVFASKDSHLIMVHMYN